MLYVAGIIAAVVAVGVGVYLMIDVIGITPASSAIVTAAGGVLVYSLVRLFSDS
jgi:hypothetical protein